MKFLRPALSVLALLTFHFAQAQYNETETNDDFPNANPVVVNAQASIDGSLGSGGDHYDYFRLNVTEYCDIKISYSTNPGVGVALGLYNSNYDQIAAMPSLNQNGTDSISFTCLKAGTYYARINDYVLNSTTLPYTMTIQLSSILPSIFVDAENNDTRDSAAWVTLQQLGPFSYEMDITGNLRYRDNGNISDINDWYKFIITSPGSLQLPQGTGNAQVSVSLKPDHGNIATDLFVNQQNYCLEPDTYYLRFNTGSFGSCFDYSTWVTFTTLYDAGQENEPNNSIANAESLGQDMNARIGYYEYDQSGTATQDIDDYYKIVTSEDGDLVVDIEPTADHFFGYAVSLLSDVSNNNLPISTLGNPAQGDTVQIRLTCVQADTFYLKIHTTGSCGGYHVHFEVETDSLGNGTNEIEPNNSIAEAQDISNDHIILSAISHRDFSSIPSIVYDDYDFYRLTPSTEGDLRVVIRLQTGTLILPGLVLMDSLGNVLINEVNDTLIYQCISRFPYYLSASASSCDQYRLEWEVLSEFGTDDEPNDMISQANDFPINGTVSAIEGRLGALQSSNLNDTYDYYKVMMGLAGNTKLWFTGEDGLGALDIWSAAGDLHSSYQAVANDSVEIDLSCLAQDTFYISVSTSSCIGYRVSGMIDFILGAPDPEPNDQVSEATQIYGSDQLWGRLGGELISQSSLGDTKDYYKLIVPGNGSLTIDVDALNSANTSLISQLLATDGVTIFESDTLWNEGEEQYVYDCMQPDTLYLLVKPLLVGLECQTYTLNVQFNGFLGTEDVEPNDDVNTAIPLVDNQTASGIVGLFRYGIADIDAGDYYSFNAQPGDILLTFNNFELLDSVRVTAWSNSEPNLLQFDGQDIPSGGIYNDGFTVNSSDPVYIEVQDIAECGFYELAVTQVVTGITSVNTSSVTVFPNPANQRIEVRGTNVTQLQLIDVQGRLLKQSFASEMQLDDVAAGTYFLKIATTGSDAWLFKRFVKE